MGLDFATLVMALGLVLAIAGLVLGVVNGHVLGSMVFIAIGLGTIVAGATFRT
jgi:hypothetical protein